MSEPIWEPGDEALRPTRNPWKCRNCGIELYTRSVIEGHKERCKRKFKKSEFVRSLGKPDIKQKPFSLKHDLRKKMRR